MKKVFLSFIVCSLFVVFAGCSFSLSRENDPQNVYKSYIQSSVSDDPDTSDSEYIFSSCSGNVVSIASTYYITQGNKRVKYVYHASGLILNAEGYILSSAASVASMNGSSPSSISAILSPLYDDASEYKITLVDKDESSGLALFKFYDTFHYKDASGTDHKGFQFLTEFSECEVRTGDPCWAVGNSLGDLFEGSNNLSITGGVIAQSSADQDVFELSYNGVSYSYMIASAPVSPEMVGGGLFDENGYLIGMFASKIVSTDESALGGGSYEYLTKMALFYKTDILIDYVNNVSEKLQTVIPITVAKASVTEPEA